MTIARVLKAAALAVLCAAPAAAEAPRIDIIDIPTAEVVDHYGFRTAFRFYTGGGVISQANFGVFPRLNLGFGLDVENVVGSGATDVNPPTLNVKLRFFDGRRYLPALAIGYDGQGYFYDENRDEYIQREKGLFLAGSGEIITPGLTLHAGGNIPEFDDDKVYGFVGTAYLIQEIVSLSAEWDNVRVARDARINLGARLYVTPSFAVDLAGRDLWSAREAERIIRLVYHGSF